MKADIIFYPVKHYLYAYDQGGLSNYKTVCKLTFDAGEDEGGQQQSNGRYGYYAAGAATVAVLGAVGGALFGAKHRHLCTACTGPAPDDDDDHDDGSDETNKQVTSDFEQMEGDGTGRKRKRFFNWFKRR